MSDTEIRGLERASRHGDVEATKALAREILRARKGCLAVWRCRAAPRAGATRVRLEPSPSWVDKYGWALPVTSGEDVVALGDVVVLTMDQRARLGFTLIDLDSGSEVWCLNGPGATEPLLSVHAIEYEDLQPCAKCKGEGILVAGAPFGVEIECVRCAGTGRVDP